MNTENFDFSYFCENYVKILHPTKRLIPFKLFPLQERLIKDYEENRFVIIKKFRQGGFTTATAIYTLWKCLFQTEQKIIWLTKHDRDAMSISAIIIKAIKHLPEDIKGDIGKSITPAYNEHTIEFPKTNSCLRFLPITAMCGISGTHVILDEPAFIANMEQWWTVIYPTLGANGKCFAVGTVNGTGNWFHKTWENGLNESWEPFSCPWKLFDCQYTEHPEYNNEEWVKNVRKNLGGRGFAQEMEGKFLEY
jgi:hypothetical protein